MKPLQLAPILGLPWKIYPTVVPGSALLLALLVAVARLAIGLDWLIAVVGGLLGVLIFWLCDLVHNYGHAIAARATGHPMIGIKFFWILAGNIYPSNEPALPAATHIRRALGGPIANALLTVLGGALLWVLRATTGLTHWLTLWFFVLNLFYYTLQVFLPLGFNDGATIWKYLRKLKASSP